MTDPLSGLERHRKDLSALIDRGHMLQNALNRDCFPDQFEKELKKQLPDKKDRAAFLEKIPPFKTSYQAWYSEARAVIAQVLPDRLSDFAKHYDKPKVRKNITFESYRIEDALQGLTVTSGWQEEAIVSPSAALPHLLQQIAILEAAAARFNTSLYDIRQILQADLFDSELEAAAALLKSGFLRPAGTLAGVVLEKHLAQVCQNRSLKVTKKSPTIGDLNDTLKQAGAIETTQWRFIQHLADVRNHCSHDRQREPTIEEVSDLLAGVSKAIKTIH